MFSEADLERKIATLQKNGGAVNSLVLTCDQVLDLKRINIPRMQWFNTTLAHIIGKIESDKKVVGRYQGVNLILDMEGE